MGFTVKELADELGVSKQAIRKHLNKLPPSVFEVTGKVNGNQLTVVSEKGAELIRKKIGSHQPVTGNQRSEIEIDNSSQKDKTIEFLQEQLKVKDEQIASLQRSLEQTTAALRESQSGTNAAQALHAGTMKKQLTEIESPAADLEKPDPEPQVERVSFFSKIFRRTGAK